MKKKNTTFHSNSMSEKFINESDIGDIFESVYTTIISKIQKSLCKSFDLTILFRYRSY